LAIFDYNIYAVCGDGCMMEGIASEAASLAAHLGLDNLCWVYDNNHITIEGNTRIAFTEDVAARFLGYGWNVLRVGDANDLGRIENALRVFQQTKGRPTFIIIESHIGYGSPHKQDTAEAHGEPLGDEEIRLTKRAYGWPEDAKFLVPDGVYEHFKAGIGKRGADAREAWTQLFLAYQKQFPALAIEIKQMQLRDLPEGWDRDLPVFPADAKGIAGREASGKMLNMLAQKIPWLLGGSADLAPSNKTTLTFSGAGDLQAGSWGGRNLHFGIREHSMAAIVNGMTLSKLRAFGATFFIFSDYARPAIRLSSLMELPTFFVFTHDAMGDGEALALSRQPLPTLDRSKYSPASGLASGAYVLSDAPGGKPEVILIASGSEVSLAAAAHEKLISEGIASRLVSMPSWDIFESQTQEYRESVLPPHVTARVAVEQASTFGWERYVGNTGRVIGMKTFGASAPLKELQRKYGFEPENVVAAAKELLGRR
jgi:transketolase